MRCALALAVVCLFVGSVLPVHAEEGAPATEGLAAEVDACAAVVAEHAKAKDDGALVADLDTLAELYKKTKDDPALSKRVIDLMGDALKAGKEEAAQVAALKALGNTEDARAADASSPSSSNGTASAPSPRSRRPSPRRARSWTTRSSSRSSPSSRTRSTTASPPARCRASAPTRP
jgi:hypothetical protein